MSKITEEIHRVKCDGCGKVLVQRDTFTNDGSFQSDWCETGDFDICKTCSFEVFTKNVAKGISKEDMQMYLSVVSKAPMADVSDFSSMLEVLDLGSILGGLQGQGK